MTITVVMEREDLVNLVCGTQPNYDQFNELKDYGRYHDNHGWDWSKGALSQLDDDTLLSIYYKVKIAWD